jgi:choline monooxygenase
VKNKFNIDPDITKASTINSEFYRSDEVFQNVKQDIFLKSWQWIGDDQAIAARGSVNPLILLDGYLTEPLVLSRDENDKLRCMSNVCTHRGNIVCPHPGKAKNLQCAYHGRRFGLDGKFEFMPEFSEACDFPAESDHLRVFPLEQWGPFLFVGLEPAFDLRATLDLMDERVGFLPLHQFRQDTSLSKEYLVHANWALYCDNYLEGFHIPFVHKDLNEALDYGEYKTELYDHMSLQVGYSDEGTEVFDLPEGHPDHGRNVAAYYYWLFPNMMFNFYPWGVSVNVVKPLSIDRTKVSFFTYVYDKSKLDSGAGALLDKVEREDEFVVEGVQKGIRSNFYKAGRYSPTREKGVHHFHRLLCDFINKE